MADKAAVDLISAYAAEIGRKGGKARLTKMTREERSRIARLAAGARWARTSHRPPDPTPPDPKGPHRDVQCAEAGIMSTPARRKPSQPISGSANSQRGGFRAA